MFKQLLFASLLIVSAFVRGTVTNLVNARLLGPIGTGVSEDGWRVTTVSNYGESYRSALKLYDKSSLVRSPVYTNTIIAVELSVVSSQSGNRRLTVTPLRNDMPVTNLAFTCECSPTKNKFISQTAVWPASERIHAFQLSLAGGTSPTWGISDMAVICEERRAPTVISIR